MQESAQDEISGLAPWEPQKYLRHIDPYQVRLARGFLQSEPQKWFPGFAMQWVPLMHAFGVEMRIRRIQPCLRADAEGGPRFAGTVDDEPIALAIDHESARRLLTTLAPSAASEAHNLLLEYLARRLLTSLALSWSGPESSVVSFDQSIDSAHIREAAAVKIELSINDSPVQIWILIGKFLAERLDNLWRKQVRSINRSADGPQELSLEIAQLAVEPAMLSEYTKPRAVVDLEVVISDRLILRENGTARYVANLVDVGGKIGCEISDDLIPNPTLPDGTTRMAIEFGRIKLQPSEVAEFSQAGAIYASELPISSRVNLVIDSENVAHAELMVFEGRFAMRVL